MVWNRSVVALKRSRVGLRQRTSIIETVSRLGSKSFCSQYNDASASGVRVRYAPSPTGYLHLGGLRTALYNYLYARKANGKFILRIEDTDKSREVAGSVEAITRVMQWCGIEYDEGPNGKGHLGPYIQSQRLDIYRKYADQLVERGEAYRCFCTAERLQSLRESQSKRGAANTRYDRKCLHLKEEEIREKMRNKESFVIRLKVPPGTTEVEDLVRGNVKFSHSVIDDQVLLKSDGFPTYHLASVVDDHLMEISHVIRGEEWLSSLPKHILLYKALGFDPPKFAHVPLLLNSDRSKLSKRQGDVDVDQYRVKGFLPVAVTNFVSLLGWNPAGGQTKEVFTLKELENEFSLEAINKSGAIVDFDRLRWLNSMHIRSIFTRWDARSSTENVEGHTVTSTDDTALAEERQSLLRQVRQKLEERLLALTGEEGNQIDDEKLWRAMDLMKEKVSIVEDFVPLCEYFFVDPNWTQPETLSLLRSHWTEETDEILRNVREEVSGQENKDANSTMKTLKKISKSNKVGMKRVLMPVRLALTGMDIGAGLGETIEELGLELSCKRLEQCPKYSEIFKGRDDEPASGTY